MKKLSIPAFIICCAFLAGCYSDKGNYDYSDINEVVIGGLPTEMIYAFRNVDNIKVTPEITGTLPGKAGEYTYLWQAVVKEGSADGKTFFDIGNEPELDYFVELPDAEYSVYLSVTDGGTGVTWKNHFTLKVTSAFYEGWLILSDQDGFCRLDMISLSTAEELIVRDIWNGSVFSTWKGPKHLVFQPDLYQNHGMYVLSADGAAKLNGDNYSYEQANEMVYELGIYDAAFRADELSINYMDRLAIVVTPDGTVYTKKGITSDPIYGLPANKVAGEEGDFKVAPAIAMPKYAYAMAPTVLVYDETNRRFLQMLDNMQGMRKPTAPETAFSYSTGKKFVWMDCGLQDGGITFAILEDDAGKFWLHGLRAQGYGALQQLPAYHYQMDAPDIEKATAFAVHPLLYHLFYAVGNTVHQFDMINKTDRVLPLSMDGSTVTSLAGETISMIKFNIFGLDVYGKPSGSANMQYRLMVGSYDTTGGDLPGKLRMFDIPTTTDRPAELYRSYSGFGKVVDVTYRERS